jgi:TDG/mug DNA glycosylase family protein
MNTLPSAHGVGICDVLCAGGSVASEYSPAVMVRAREHLYGRLRGHMARARANAQSLGQPVGDAAEFAPRVVAFSGKRHWALLFEPALKRVDSFGLQPPGLRPPGWPLPPSRYCLGPHRPDCVCVFAARVLAAAA